ncbi:MAG: glyoxylase-like metal-dependent hydrolase (beta-lactamase superfamily II) [Paracoccaceae bacterium]|jgi:glyoxylase-like metal-dependent hydrolase (beta-lactamase superfamily II)
MITPQFFNSAFVPANRRLVQASAPHEKLRLPVRWGLFEHPNVGWVMIDTGYMPAALSAPDRSLGLRIYSAALRAQLHEAGQPEVILARLGLTPADVAMVIVTHFHADHVAGLRSFVNARFVASGAAIAAVQARSYLGNMKRGVFGELVPADFKARMVAIEDLAQAEAAGLMGGDIFGDGTVLAIPLSGHAEGHFGLLFPGQPRPFLYGVDAQWLMAAVTQNAPPGYPARLIFDDYAAGLVSVGRLRKFMAQGGDLALCHDPAKMPYDGDA